MKTSLKQFAIGLMALSLSATAGQVFAKGGFPGGLSSRVSGKKVSAPKIAKPSFSKSGGTSMKFPSASSLPKMNFPKPAQSKFQFPKPAGPSNASKPKFPGATLTKGSKLKFPKPAQPGSLPGNIKFPKPVSPGGPKVDFPKPILPGGPKVKFPKPILPEGTKVIPYDPPKIILLKPDWCDHWHGCCHWWYDYCLPIRFCHPVHCVSYTYDYVTCDATLAGGVVEDARWYLGLKGMLLPAKGLGVESVEQNSPADLAGLKPGMVITRCNGIDLVDEAAMPRAIEQSGGLLKLVVLSSLDGEEAEVTIQMRRLVSQSF